MIERDKCERMRCWDDGDGIKGDRIVIDINNNGSCIAVNNQDEDAFLRGDDFGVLSWDHCEPIPEKKTRPMTNAEMLGFIANTPGIEIKRYNWASWHVNISLNNSYCPSDFIYRTISLTGETGEPQKFEVEVEE